MEEGKKRAVVAACCLLIVLLSAQQQQAAASAFTKKFCICYKKCYTDCRKNSGPYPCNFECLQDCFNGQPPPSAPASAADCKYACLIRTCGVVETAMAAPGDAEACVADCTEKLGAFAPDAAVAKIN